MAHPDQWLASPFFVPWKALILTEMEEVEQEKRYVYQAATELIQVKGLESFIEYLQEVAETGRIPKSCTLDKDTYLSVLRQAIHDYRKKILE